MWSLSAGKYKVRSNGCVTVLPVSSDLPLASLKEFEWLPACLYFLNLSIKNKST